MTNCTTCIHRNVCSTFVLAEVVECEQYQPLCKACKFWGKDEKRVADGMCKAFNTPMMTDDYCSMGDAVDG